MKKKLLSALLVLAMMLTMIPTAFAVETSDTGYGGEILPAGPTEQGDVLTVTPENAQYTLDGAYGSINGKTIHFSKGSYTDVLVLARPTKYAGSGTNYFKPVSGGFDKQEITDLMNTGVYWYDRTVSNVTFTADEGVVLPGFTSGSGHVYETSDKVNYDYVRDINVSGTVTSYYASCSLEDITFKNLTISGQVELNDYSDSGYTKNAVNQNITFDGCTFTGDKTKMADKEFAAIKMKADKKYYSNITVRNCTIKDYYQGIYIQGVNGATIENNYIQNTTHNAIALQSSATNPVMGTVVISENVIDGTKDRAIRFGEFSADYDIAINNNVMTNSGDSDHELIKAESVPAVEKVSLEYNYWSGENLATAVQNFHRPESIGVINGTFLADPIVGLASGYTATLENGKYVVSALTADDAVAKVGDKYYPTLKDAVENAPEGSTIILLKDVTIPKAENSWAILIDKSLVIDGQGKYTITDSNNQRTFRCENKTTTETDVTFQNVTIINSSTESGSRCIETRNDTINLMLDHVTLKTPASGNSQPLTIGGNHSNLIDVTIRNSEIVASSTGYAILTFNPSKMLIENSTLTGWAGLYFKGELSSFGSKNSDVMVKNCTINSGNIAGAAGGWNNFGAIVFEDNNVKLTLEDTALNVSSFEPNETQEIFSFNMVNAAENGEHVTQNQVFINGADTKVSVEGNMACISESATDNTISITAGHFTSDPSAFLAEGKAAVASGRADYPWMVTDATGSIVEPAVGEPDVTIPESVAKYEEVLKAAAEDIEVQGLEAYASTVAQQSNVTQETAMNTLNEEGIQANEENTHVYAQVYLEIVPTSYTEPAVDGGESVVPKLTMEITPMYRLVASTADDPAKIAVKGDDNVDETIANAVVIPNTESEKLDVKGPVHMVVPMPDGFITEPVPQIIFVQHKNYEYPAEVTEHLQGKFVAEFDNPHGFSTFTFTMNPVSEAALNGIGYAKFADAIADTKNGETVFVLKDGLTAEMSGDSRTITVKNGTEEKITFKVNGKDYTLEKKDDKVQITYTRPTTGGGSVSTYTLTFEVNGGSELKKLTRAYGTTIDLSDYIPTRAGYTFAGWYSDKELTEKVTSIKLNSNTTVYAKWTLNAGGTVAGFTDVKIEDWFAEEVQYVVDKGLMSGTSSTTFAPNGTTTRGMIVAILYRMEKEPTAPASAFTDVKAGAYYEKAIDWAAANEIVKGVSETTFAPDQAITREQLAAILYRYAQFKGYNVSKMNKLDSYADAAQVSPYAVSAMQWANAENLITGKSATILDPKGNATRAEVSSILMRFCENIAK